MLEGFEKGWREMGQCLFCFLSCFLFCFLLFRVLCLCFCFFLLIDLFHNVDLFLVGVLFLNIDLFHKIVWGIDPLGGRGMGFACCNKFGIFDSNRGFSNRGSETFLALLFLLV